MDLERHPPADSREMFTQLDPKIVERHQRFRDALEQEYKANEQLPSSDSSR